LRAEKSAAVRWAGAGEDTTCYFVDVLVGEDDALRNARARSRAAGLPAIEVAPNQGKLLALLTRMAGARRVLEFGTLAGYSTIWLARAVGPDGVVVSLELDPEHARVARANLDAAEVGDRVEVLVRPARDSAERMAEAGTAPFDLVFIDADKPNNPVYLESALALSRPGTVIVVDNVVRNGAVTDAGSSDPSVLGVRSLIAAVAADPRLDGTAVQTVGLKGWDGMLLALVR
jgi:predicted O-methyltransferase YrrM